MIGPGLFSFVCRTWPDRVKCVIAHGQPHSRSADRRISRAAIGETSYRRVISCRSQRVLALASRRARRRPLRPPSRFLLARARRRRDTGRHVIGLPVHAVTYGYRPRVAANGFSASLPTRYALSFSRLGVPRRTFRPVLYAGRALSCRLPWPGLLLLRAAVRFRRGVSQPPAVEVRYQREGGRYRGGGNGRPGRGGGGRTRHRRGPGRR